MADFQRWLSSTLDRASAAVLVCGAFDVLDVTGELGNEVQVVHLTGGMLPEAVGLPRACLQKCNSSSRLRSASWKSRLWGSRPIRSSAAELHQLLHLRHLSHYRWGHEVGGGKEGRCLSRPLCALKAVRLLSVHSRGVSFLVAEERRSLRGCKICVQPGPGIKW